MISNILVLCQGNICRSPMAEALLKDKFRNINISSAGLGAMIGFPADELAVNLMRGQGLDISNHLARQISEMMVRKADIIFVMTQRQKDEMLRIYPYVRGRVFRVGENGKFDVPDPYQLGERAFEEAFSAIDLGLKNWMPVIKKL